LAKPTQANGAKKPKAKGGWLGRILSAIVIAGLLVFVIGPIVVVAVYRFVPPPITYLMVERTIQGRGFDRRWRPIEKISPTLVRAVIAAEDARFCEHHGFDFNAIQKAMAHNEAGKKIRGGSTISQQTAKNVFLWPHRDWVRKGLETWFTVLIEGIWGKPRIMEVYLNSIEWGPGVYGAEAVVQRNFGVLAVDLTPVQAVRLAVIVPKPLAWKADKPGRFVRRRSGTIAARAGVVRRQGLADCVFR